MRLSRLWTTFFFALLLAAPAASSAQALPDFTDLVEANAPAVVNISTVQRPDQQASQGQRPQMPPGVDPREIPDFFRYFFEGGPGGGPSRERERRSLGSGFIVSQDGYVVTNSHVVRHADEIFVRLNDRREFAAEVVGSDPRSDLALLKIDAQGLPSVNMGSEDPVEVGEWVLAIGSPFGFDYSVTAGIVSAKGRSLPDEANENYVPFIQTDVAINPGNSGGPLFNLEGQVVGINSQIYTRSGGFMGLSFAVPADVAMEVIDQLKTKGSVSRGWLGVMIQQVSRELADSFGLKKPRGALVAQVLDGSPAQEAGLQEGDIIIRFNGEPIQRSGDLPPRVGSMSAGKTASMVVVREGNRKQLQVTLGELPPRGERQRQAGRGDGRGGTAANILGLTVTELEGKAAEQLEAGVIVSNVSGGPAARARIRRGDVITRLNNQAVTSVSRFNEIVRQLPRGRSVPALVVRQGTPTFLALQVPEAQ